MRQAGEPSVEEILDSIKKVIARDNRAGAAVERKERQERGLKTAAPEAFDEDDVFELDASAELVEDAEDGPLLPEYTATSMRESLAALAMLAEPGVPPQIVRSGETSLEGPTRELHPPALAQWLDKALPTLVQRTVEAEIARIVGKKG